MIIGKQASGSSDGPIYDMSHTIVSSWRLPRSCLIADIGGGRGIFAERLLSDFDHIHILDHEPCPVPPAITYLRADLNLKWDLPDAAYDGAVALEVIEHIENPRHFMRELHRITKPGGRCLVTSPNQLSVSSKISLLLRNQFRDFTDNCYPAHITALVKQDLARIANEAGFKVRGFRFTNSGRIPFLRYTWQRAVPVLRGQAFSDNIAIDLFRPQ